MSKLKGKSALMIFDRHPEYRDKYGRHFWARGYYAETIGQVYYLYREKKQPLVLAMDEAQYLNYNILRDLKMLLNHSYDSLNCFSLVLVGEPYLNHILDKQVHEALRQRITVHYNYEGLSGQEVPDYICHKLELAGGSRSIVSAK